MTEYDPNVYTFAEFSEVIGDIVKARRMWYGVVRREAESWGIGITEAPEKTLTDAQLTSATTAGPRAVSLTAAEYREFITAVNTMRSQR